MGHHPSTDAVIFTLWQEFLTATTPTPGIVMETDASHCVKQETHFKACRSQPTSYLREMY